jgi:hypothetical protein
MRLTFLQRDYVAALTSIQLNDTAASYSLLSTLCRCLS